MAFSPITDIIVWRLRSRMPALQEMSNKPMDAQQHVFKSLLAALSLTEYGRAHGATPGMSYEQYRQIMPLVNYESLLPWVERTMRGEQGLLWPTDIKWFAKSSGTTSTRSKFIPVSRESLEDCHMKAGRDLVAMYCVQTDDSQLFDGLTLKLGGSSKMNDLNGKSYYGDLSAILIHTLPLWAEWRSTPSHDIALMEEWEEKLEMIAQQVVKQNVTSLFGVPSWMLVLMRRVLEIADAQHLSEVWPNLELFVHGGVSYAPYEEPFKAILPENNFSRLETYNASEGFFAAQDRLNEEGMLLFLDHGIFYEFVPIESFQGRRSEAVPLEGVELGKTYAVIITTNGGLWRYILGDTVRFTSVAPYRVVVSGRTRLFINAFGEELMMDNAERAMAEACQASNAHMLDYTAAPVFMEGGSAGAHEWLIEFSQEPADPDAFRDLLDASLKRLNTDYEAKRHKDMVLRPPIIHIAPRNTFHNWLKSKGKLGGQHKVPRLSNDRVLMDALLEGMES